MAKWKLRRIDAANLLNLQEDGAGNLYWRSQRLTTADCGEVWLAVMLIGTRVQSRSSGSGSRSDSWMVALIADPMPFPQAGNYRCTGPLPLSPRLRGTLASADLARGRYGATMRPGPSCNRDAMQSFFYVGSVAVLILAVLGVLGALIKR
jgi:hypothetical protein